MTLTRKSDKWPDRVTSDTRQAFRHQTRGALWHSHGYAQLVTAIIGDDSPYRCANREAAATTSLSAAGVQIVVWQGQ